jgi:hypothetical protein
MIEDPAALMREEHVYMARWLALTVLLNDEVVCADEALYNHLSEFQEQQEKQMLATRGMS